MNMMETDNLLSRLHESILNHRQDSMLELLAVASEEGISSKELHRGIVDGLEQARLKLMSNRVPVAEFLLCIDTAKKGLEKTAAQKQDLYQSEIIGYPLVIGVVEGDPHDIGKDIVAEIYRFHGFQVFDLGCNVTQEEFLAGVDDHQAEVLALSAMMSTTMQCMKAIIREVKNRHPHTAVIVGGAPLNSILARSFGADSYAESALEAIEKTHEMLETRRP